MAAVAIAARWRSPAATTSLIKDYKSSDSGRRCLLFPDGIDESGFFQFLNEAGIHRIGWVEIFGAGVAKLDRFEHEFDPLHIDVRDPILKTGHRVIGRVQHLYIPI